MRPDVKTLPRSRRPRCAGFSLVELLVALTILSGVTGLLIAVLTSSEHTQRRTMARAEVQAAARQTMNLVTSELRQAGSDPRIPPVGVVGVIAADSTTLRIRADLNADGAIQTTEPSEEVIYSYNAVAQTVSRNPGTGAEVVQRGVTNLRFTYFDADNQPLTALPLSTADRALVHSVGVTFTCDAANSHPLTMTTLVTLRNQ